MQTERIAKRIIIRQTNQFRTNGTTFNVALLPTAGEIVINQMSPEVLMDLR